MDIHRGDGFQFLCSNKKKALKAAIMIRARLRFELNLDARVSIGLGTVDHYGQDIAGTSGEALTRAGRSLDRLKDIGQNMLVTSGHPLDIYINTCLKLADTIMDNWLTKSAEVIYYSLLYPEKTQEEIGRELSIRQATVSRRTIRAHADELNSVLALFRRYLDDITQ
jgi:hypothetical protein